MDHFTVDAAMTSFLHLPWWNIEFSFWHVYPRNEDPFLKSPSFCTLFSLLHHRTGSISVRVRQSSVVLSRVYTVASAFILLTQTSRLGRSTVKLNICFVLIFCLRSYPLFNYPFHLKDIESEDHENSSLHRTTTTDLEVSTFTSGKAHAFCGIRM